MTPDSRPKTSAGRRSMGWFDQFGHGMLGLDARLRQRAA
jgi:hypothetical protein